MTMNIKRRKFLKYTAVGVSAAALEHYMSPLLGARQPDENAYINRNTGKRAKGIPSTCAGCGAGCGIVAYVQDGQLMKIGGNPAHPVNKGRLCLIGEAGIYTQYDPERVTKPLVRIGRRGQGGWKEISWDEALQTVAVRLKGLGRKGIVLDTRGGPSGPASREFLSRLGGGTLLSHDYIISPNREAAMRGMFGVPYDVPDIANTKYILNFGANPYESDPFGVATVAAITAARAKDGAVKMVTFDPRLSATAGRSDEWLPILPGTDGIVAMAMAGVIIREGLHDAAFMQRWTNVSVSELAAHLTSYTPTAAERISGIKADDIRRIAVEYAGEEKAVLLTGGGVSKHADGTANERAVRLLSIITGKLDRVGCNRLPEPEVKAKAPGVDEKTPEAYYSELKDGKVGPGVYISHGCDPVYSSPESRMMAEIFSDEGKVPFVVCMDTHVTDTGRFADMVLPMATFLEEYGVEVVSGPNAMPVVNYTQPAVLRAGDSRPYVDVICELSRMTGEALGYQDSEEYAETRLAGMEGLAKNGGVEYLAKAGFFSPSKHGTARSYLSGGFGTPSKKIEVRWAKGGALPAYEKPKEYNEWKDDDFVLVKYNPVGYSEGRTENNLLLKEINHKNMVFMNSSVGRALGFESREQVTLTSSVGKITATVMLTPGVHPRAIALAAGCGHEGCGRIEGAERFASSDPFTDIIWWHTEGKGVNPNNITPFNIDKASGGQGWMLTSVKVDKA